MRNGEAKQNDTLLHYKVTEQPIPSDSHGLPKRSESERLVSLLITIGVVVAIVGLIAAIDYLEAHIQPP
jgi:hypothetical protein